MEIGKDNSMTSHFTNFHALLYIMLHHYDHLVCDWNAYRSNNCSELSYPCPTHPRRVRPCLGSGVSLTCVGAALKNSFTHERSPIDDVDMNQTGIWDWEGQFQDQSFHDLQ